MLLSDFPQEILEKFVRFLSHNDKLSCSLVCKSWKEIFHGYLYSNLAIKSRTAFNDLVNPPRDKKSIRLESRHLVRYMRIGYFSELTDDEIHALQKVFPNVKCIYFVPDSISPRQFGITSDWHPWRLLREFNISFEYLYIPDIENKLIKILQCLPLLIRLEIVDRFWKPNQIIFSLDNIEIIHSHLKHLEHFRLHVNLLNLSDADLERIPQVSLATNMIILDTSSNKTDHRWLCYFARKYSNLHTLEFSTDIRIPYSDEQRDSIITLFQQVPQAFKYLTKLNLQYRNCIGRDTLLFCKMIRYHDIPLKDIRIDIRLPYGTYTPGRRYTLCKNIPEICLSKFSNTIKSFHVACQTKNAIPTDLMKIKDKLYGLVELSLNIPTEPMDLDTLLCAAPLLKSLGLSNTHIKVKDQLYGSKRFVLQSFKGYELKITSDVLRFLSFHCRDFNELDLGKVSVYGSLTTPGYQFIDMSYSRLKNLQIKNTEFIIQHDKESTESVKSLITRAAKDTPPKKGGDPNSLPAFIEAPGKAYNHWFYIDSENGTYELSKSHGSRIEKYILSNKKNKKVIKEKGHDTKRRKMEINWNKIRAFGCTKIKLGYVAECNIRLAL